MPARSRTRSRTPRAQQPLPTVSNLVQFLSRNPSGTPIVYPANDVRYVHRPGTRHRGSRPQGPLIEVEGVNALPYMMHGFTRRRIPSQRGEPLMSPLMSPLLNHDVVSARHIHTPDNNIMFNNLNRFMPHAAELPPTPLVREQQHNSTLAVNHALAQLMGTIGYITKRGEVINPRRMRFEDLGRNIDDVAKEVKVLMYKNRHMLPEDRARAIFLLDLMAVFNEQKTLELITEISRVMREKELRQLEEDALERARTNIANRIRARPVTMRNRAASLGRRISRGIQRRLGTRASRNSNNE
jgi:hypothetical protein